MPGMLSLSCTARAAALALCFFCADAAVYNGFDDAPNCKTGSGADICTAYGGRTKVRTPSVARGASRGTYHTPRATLVRTPRVPRGASRGTYHTPRATLTNTPRLFR